MLLRDSTKIVWVVIVGSNLFLSDSYMIQCTRISIINLRIISLIYNINYKVIFAFIKNVRLLQVITTNRPIHPWSW